MFAQKGRSGFFGSADDPKPLELREAFQAFGRGAPNAAKSWLERLRLLNREAICGIVESIPAKRMSETCKRFTIELKAGTTYQIDMVRVGNKKQNMLDPFLRLEDSNGKELAKDDDGGGIPNARIIFDCTANGAYTIVATSFNGSTGAFGLSVKAAGKVGASA